MDSSHFFLSFSQAEAEEKKKAEAEARNKRESEKTPLYAVSGMPPLSHTWHSNLNIFQSLKGGILALGWLSR